MNFENVSVLSVAHVDAPHRVRSEDIERKLAPTMERLGFGPDLLRDLSGIMERRFWDEGVMPSEVAAMAGEKALEKAGIDRSRVGILINTSVCRDYMEPSTASIAHSQLGLPETCMNFDLGNACLGFVNGIDMVGNMVERGQVDFGILVDGETSRQITETTIALLQDPEIDESTFRENFASLTLGSVAAAMVLGRSDLAPEGHAFKGSVNLAATQHCRLCAGNIDQMVTRTRELLMAGMELAVSTWGRAAEVLGWTADTIDHFVFHQVSKAHTEQLAALLGIDLRKVFRIYPDFGNIGPAGVPIVLSKLEDTGRLERGQRVALMGIGSGLNCTMAELVW
ncbi:MAG: 3-oxoacyl-ACP synthase III [Acidobacteria bacterium]|nr:3-oxoacyl-ACP synthase III [Candidatus Sulfomarinibacter sp. MAG AM2]